MRLVGAISVKDGKKAVSQVREILWKKYNYYVAKSIIWGALLRRPLVSREGEGEECEKVS